MYPTRESNPRQENQNLLCYLYTSGTDAAQNRIFLLDVIVVSNDVEKESFYRLVFILSFAVYSTFNGSWMLDSSIFHSIFQSIKYPNDVAINTTLDNLIRPFVYGKGKWVSIIPPNKTFICLG